MDAFRARTGACRGRSARAPLATRAASWWLALLLVLFAPLALALPSALVEPLAGDDPEARSQALARIATSADPLAARVIEALGDERLHYDSGVAVLVEGERALRVDDGVAVARPRGDAIVVNNRLRGEIETFLAGLRLADPDAAVRLQSAKVLADSALPSQRESIARALEQAADAKLRPWLLLALARIDLADDDPQRRVQAIRALGASDDPQIRSLLSERRAEESDPAAKTAIDDALAAIAARMARSEWVGVVLTGISLGSVLLLAALGLAITYGVMGVINMAHGELLMVGAYATWLTQAAFRAWLPGWVDWYVVAAVPVAVLAAAAVGLVIERTVIRFLYGRPLETLLATFGVSLLLAQGARTLFGAQNVELANPSWMSGGLELSSTLVLPCFVPPSSSAPRALKRFVPAGRLKAMTLFACVPMPYSMVLPALRSDWPPALALTRTLPKPASADFHSISVSFFSLPSARMRRGSAQSAQSAAKPLPPSVTTRKSSFAPSSDTSISTLWFGVSLVMTLDWKSGFGAARASVGSRRSRARRVMVRLWECGRACSPVIFASGGRSRRLGAPHRGLCGPLYFTSSPRWMARCFLSSLRARKRRLFTAGRDIFKMVQISS
jgi:hypothetical protein